MRWLPPYSLSAATPSILLLLTGAGECSRKLPQTSIPHEQQAQHLRGTAEAVSQPPSVQLTKRPLLTPDEFARLPNGSYGKMANGVPKVLHQMWKSRDILPAHLPYVRSWQQCLPPDWVHVLWTDDDMFQFLAQRSPNIIRPTLKLYHYNIQKVDMFRYVMLAAMGGVYADLDNECRAPPVFPDMNSCKVYLAEQPQIVAIGGSRRTQRDDYKEDIAQPQVLRRRKHGAAAPPPVQNSMMATTARHPFWGQLLELAVERGPANNWIYRALGMMPIHKTVGVHLLSVADFMFGVGEDPSVCLLTNTVGDESEWKAANATRNDGFFPRYVFHHGTHVWNARKKDMQQVKLLVLRFVPTLLIFIFLCCWIRRHRICCRQPQARPQAAHSSAVHPSKINDSFGSNDSFGKQRPTALKTIVSDDHECTSRTPRANEVHRDPFTSKPNLHG